MFGEMCRELINDVTSLFDGNRKRIKFATSNSTPYEIVAYLEAMGVKCWPTHDIKIVDGTAEGSVLVTEKQYRYAAGLVEGYAGFKCLSPQGVTPIQPTTSWGAPNRSAGGILAGMARRVGAEAKVPPKKVKTVKTAKRKRS